MKGTDYKNQRRMNSKPLKGAGDVNLSRPGTKYLSKAVNSRRKTCAFWLGQNPAIQAPFPLRGRSWLTRPTADERCDEQPSSDLVFGNLQQIPRRSRALVGHVYQQEEVCSSVLP